MKTIAFYLISFTSCFSLGANFELNQHVGSNWGATNVFDIQYVNINPWPPGPGTVASLQMVGTFRRPTYVQQIVLGTCINSMFWNYDPVNIDKQFAAEEYEFLMEIKFPTDHASYITNIQLTSGGHICCWQFSYHY